VRADPRLVPRRRQRTAGEAARDRAAGAAALGRLRHGLERRPHQRARGDGLAVSALPNAVAAPGFADAMSTLASGVVLVTCRVAERPWGMTVTAFASVSASPPTVLVSLCSRTAGARAIESTGSFGISILAAGQEDVAEHGSASGTAKFLDALVEPRDRASSAPAIAGALAHLD